MRKLRFLTKTNKRFYSRYDVLGSYTGTGMGDFEPEVDVDDL